MQFKLSLQDGLKLAQQREQRALQAMRKESGKSSAELKEPRN